VTVLDRRGRRLGTVYLAYVPEFGQGTMSKQLTVSVRRRHVARAGVAAQPDARSQWNRNGYGR
jgi:hypothetical protein